MMRTLLCLAALCLAACRASSPLAKEAPFDGVSVAHRIHRATHPKAAVVIVPGRTEVRRSGEGPPGVRSMGALIAAVLLGAAPAVDDNTAGFAAYKKGDLQKARLLFEKAQKSAPKDAWAHLNWARVVTRTREAAPETWAPSCSLKTKTPWAFQAVTALDRAVHLAPEAVRKKIEDDEDQALAPLKETLEYQAWDATLNPVPVDELLKRFPRWHNEGHMGGAFAFENDAVVFTFMREDTKGTFRVEGSRVVITMGETSTTYTLSSKQWPFDEGKKTLSRLVLTSEKGAAFYIGDRELIFCAGGC